jgi:hypothetical protein
VIDFYRVREGREVNNMIKLSSSNAPGSDYIVKLIDAFINENCTEFFIVSELCEVSSESFSLDKEF